MTRGPCDGIRRATCSAQLAPDSPATLKAGASDDDLEVARGMTELRTDCRAEMSLSLGEVAGSKTPKLLAGFESSTCPGGCYRTGRRSAFSLP